MRKIICLTIMVCLLVGCSNSKSNTNKEENVPAQASVEAIESTSDTASEANQTVNVPEPTYSELSESLKSSFDSQYDEKDIEEQVTDYLQQYFTNLNFSAYSESDYLFANKTVKFRLFYGSDMNIKVELETKGKGFTEDEQLEDFTVFWFDIELDNTIAAAAKVESDTLRYELVGEGSITIGDPYSPNYEDFDGKEEMLKEMKDALHERYYGNPDRAQAPVFEENTKAKMVYLMDFNEVNVAQDSYTVLIVTEDEEVYIAEMYYDSSLKQYECHEIISDSVYYINDYENAKSQYVIDTWAYFKRIMKYAVITLSE